MPSDAAWLPFSSMATGETDPVFEVIKSGPGEILVELSLPGIEHSRRTGKDQQDLFDVLSIPGCGMTMEIGGPALPVFRKLVGLYFGHAPSVEIVATESIILDNLRIYPALAPALEGEEPLFRTDRTAYAGDYFHPAHLAVAGEPEIMRDIVVSRLTISPVQYNPLSGSARIYTRIRVRLVEAESKGGVVPGAISHSISPDMSRLYSNVICNYRDLDPPDFTIDTDAPKYLVITLPRYYSNIADLLRWRVKAGYPGRLVSLEDTGSSSTEIKAYISDLYFTYGLEYVLLVGDIDEIPAHNWVDTYSDSYYSCVDPGGDDDYLADLAIGRITFDDKSELTHQIAKIMSYLKNPDVSSTWVENIPLVAHEQSYPGKYTECSEDINARDYLTLDPLFDEVYGGAGAGNDDVIDAVNNGCGILNYRGHGTSTKWYNWGSDGSFTGADVDDLINDGMLFVCLGICCSNLKLDIDGDCLAESFMKGDYAAVAYLSSWGLSYTDANHTFDKALFKTIFDEGVTTIGFVENRANVEVHTEHGDYGDANIRQYLWLGDPATDIWTSMPTPFDVLYPATITDSPQEVEVVVLLGGRPFEGARVCLSRDYEILSYGFTDSEGTVNLTIFPGSAGDISITVTGHNGLPFEESMEVVETGGPWIVLDEFLLDDKAGGNGDGFADYGETVVLNSAIRNNGTGDAYDVDGLFSSDDSYVDVKNYAEFYGDVPAGGYAWGWDQYSFSVDRECIDGHAAVFDLSFTDSRSSSWTGDLVIILHAPVLEAGNIRMDDAASGDGDGKLEPGEESELFVAAVNSGSCEARDLSAVIFSDDKYLVILNNSASYPEIAGGGEADGNDPFVLRADSVCPEGHIANIEVTFTAKNGYSAIDTFSVRIGGFFEDMEEGEGEWEHGALTPGFNDEWHLSTEKNYTEGGTSSWKCGDEGSGYYSTYNDSWLLTPVISLGEGSKLAFRHWMDAELHEGDLAWDGGIVEISNDDGATWVLIEPESGYPYMITDGNGCPFDMGTPCFSGYINWEKEIFDLSGYSGSVKIRFRFGSGGYTYSAGEGWYIDDVEVVSENRLSRSEFAVE